MKIFSALLGRRPLSRKEAWGCVLVNQFATPGLGSLAARRWVAATGQLLLSFGGFGLFLGWFFQKVRLLYGQMFGTNIPLDAGDTFLNWGLTLFGIAWAWAWITSIQIIRSAPKDSPPPAIPPKIR
jgi:hypothetical protein